MFLSGCRRSPHLSPLHILVPLYVMPQVQTILGATAKHGKTVLQFAAQSGNKESFEAVLATVKKAFNAEKVTSVPAPEITLSPAPTKLPNDTQAFFVQRWQDPNLNASLCPLVCVPSKVSQKCRLAPSLLVACKCR